MNPVCVSQQGSRVSIEALLHGPMPESPAHYDNSIIKEQSVCDNSSVNEQSASSSSSVKEQNIDNTSSKDTKEQDIRNTPSRNTLPSTLPSTSCNRPHISCMNCQTTSTPLWRRDPSTGSHLCNRCGLYLKTYNVMHPLIRIKHRPTTKRTIPEMDDVEQVPRPANCHPPQLQQLASVQRRKRVTPKQQISLGITPKCFNCGAEHTPLWRRDPADNIICNACGLYHKLHDKPRPVAMRRAIKRRNRALGPQSVPANTSSRAGLDALRRAAEMSQPDGPSQLLCQTLSQPHQSHPCSMLESLASVATAEIASTKGTKEHLQKECQRLEQQLAKSKAILSSLR